jgi:predicted ribosomally synthesized peptide with SipW-like signal peptide
METRTKVAAGATAFALAVLGGGTYAFWNDSATVTDSSVQSGYLDLTVSTITAFDTSDFQEPNIDNDDHLAGWGVPINHVDDDGNEVAPTPGTAPTGTPIDGLTISDFDDFVFAPGDEVYVVSTAQVDMEGNNLAAQLSVVEVDSAGNTSDMSLFIEKGFTVTPVGIIQVDDTVDYTVWDNVSAALADGNGTATYFFSNDSSAATTNEYLLVYKVYFYGHTDIVTNDGSGNYTGTINGTSSDAYAGGANMQVSLAGLISTTAIQLQQVRDLPDTEVVVAP